MNITIPRGAGLLMDWELPFDTPPAEQVQLDMNGEVLTFRHAARMTASITRLSHPDAFKLLYYGGQWHLRLETSEYPWLQDGENPYEMIVLNLGSVPIIIDTGVVTIDG